MDSLIIKRLTKEYERLHKRFHIDYVDIDECLEEAYKLYEELEGTKETVIDKNLYFKTLFFIINIRCERMIETKEDDLDLIYFIKNCYKYTQSEYDEVHLKFMEAKCLSLNSVALDKVIYIYKETEIYYLNLIGNTNINKEELFKQIQNISNLRLELSEIYNKTNNILKSSVYAIKSIIGFIDLYIEQNISLECLRDTYKRFLKIVKINNKIEDIQQIDRLLNKYDIVL